MLKRESRYPAARSKLGKDDARRAGRGKLGK
jgi:hypothetical protein